MAWSECIYKPYLDNIRVLLFIYRVSFTAYTAVIIPSIK